MAICGALSGGASACGCGEFPGAVVAHGSSPHGVPWRIKASREGANTHDASILVQFSYGSPDNGNGYSFGAPLPVPRELVLNADAGSPDEYPERDLSGVTATRAVELKLKMSNGRVLTVEPTLPPRSLRKRLTWLRGLRFFDVFFPAVQKVEAVTAFDRSGHVLGHGKSQRGIFSIF